MTEDIGYREVLKLFPMPQLARRVFGTLENGRIDRRLRRTYRGLSRDLDLIRQHLSRSRPRITELPGSLVPFELLFQVTMLGGARDDARIAYGQIVSELETIVSEYLVREQTTVADTLMATSRVYDLFQSVDPDRRFRAASRSAGRSNRVRRRLGRTERMKQRQSQQMPQRRDARELFNAWNDPSPKAIRTSWPARKHGPKLRRRSRCLLKAKLLTTTTSGIAS